MTELAPFQNVFRLGKQASSNGVENARVIKRNRLTLSCTSCRSRKLKCNRQIPCSQCVGRGSMVASSCSYASDISNARIGGRNPAKASEVQSRLQNLEKLISTLVDSHKDRVEDTVNAGESLTSKTDQQLNRLSFESHVREAELNPKGHLSKNGQESSYFGATNWTTILDSIRGIQDSLEPVQEELVENPQKSGGIEDLDLVFSTDSTLTIDDVCKSLPPKSIADLLLSNLFENGYSQFPVIHTAKFLKDYEAFWVEPSSASFLWISILFSLMWIGSFCSNGENPGSLQPSSRSLFFRRAGQALIVGKYSRGGPYSLEAVLMYTHCKYFMQAETEDADTWMMVGTVVRLALRMGYHRDPRHFLDISPFDGEMRRRTFFILQLFDLLLSIKNGLPEMLREEESDTDPPRNLLDDDFDEDCEELPPSRPLTDRTPLLYFCYKSQFAHFLKRVFRHALAFKSQPYENTMQLDAEIHEAHQSVPPGLQMKPVSLLLSDTARMLTYRIHVELLYLKSLCVLHRDFLSRERSNPKYDYSRKVCTDAALGILHLQAELHEVTKPGSRFENNSWIYSSLTTHDFLFGAILVCLDLYETYNKPSTQGSQRIDDIRKKYDALQRCHKIISLQQSTGHNQRALSVLAAMLAMTSRPPEKQPADVLGESRPTDQSVQTPKSQTPLMVSPSYSGHSPPSTAISSWTRPSIPIFASVPNLEERLDFPNEPASTNITPETSLNINGNPYETLTDPLRDIFASTNPDNEIDWGLVDQYISMD